MGPTWGPSGSCRPQMGPMLARNYFDAFVQDCSNASALAMELMQSCTKPSIWYVIIDSLTLKDVVMILKLQSPNACHGLISWTLFVNIGPRLMQQNTFDDKSTLVHVVVRCRQATKQFLSQYWSRYKSLYGITGPQRVHTNLSHCHCRQQTGNSLVANIKSGTLSHTRLTSN